MNLNFRRTLAAHACVSGLYSFQGPIERPAPKTDKPDLSFLDPENGEKMKFIRLGDGRFETYYKGIRIVVEYDKTTGIRQYHLHFPRKTVTRQILDTEAFAKYQTCPFAEPAKPYRPKATDMWPMKTDKRAVFKNRSGYKKPFFPKH